MTINLSQLASLCTITQKPAINTPLPPRVVIGVDEVGRGALFGHMTVAAAILPSDLTGNFGEIDLGDTPIKLLNDSKKLTEKRRESLFEPIKSLAYDYAIVDVPRTVIDEINIANATMFGMRLAIESLLSRHQLTPSSTSILVDGVQFPNLQNGVAAAFYDNHTLIKGDGTHSTIACASILAKVHRDRAMVEYGKVFPEYRIEGHKGYLTAVHKAAILEHGILPEHRRSYSPIKELYHNGFINRTYWQGV